MGVGKSTLTAALSDRLGARAYYESVDDHPYLERFYEDMARWSFQSQFYFLSQAFTQHCEIAASPFACVQDRTIYEHFHVFASSLHDQGLLDDADHKVLGDHYKALEAVVPGPDLMIYLRASVSTLTDRIQTRDRGCESTVSSSYLEELEQRYEAWMASYETSDVLIIDTDSIDIHNPQQREALLSLIEDRVRKHPMSALDQVASAHALSTAVA
jgi:deoxyadenosine/deoxycytidine kinase